MAALLVRGFRRIPVLVRAVIAGLALAAAGTIPWSRLVKANLHHAVSLPWVVPIMAVYLWLFWHYARGAGWPQATAVDRRTNARANPLPPDVWGPALMAGMLGLVSILLLQGVMGRLVHLPRQQDFELEQYPLGSVVAWVIMSAVVAGVVEETSFRGYMQRPIERRHGPFVAIIVTGSLFGLAHFTHPEVGVVLLPYYLAVAAVYGMLAFLTDSTLPSMVLHAGGNLFSVFDLLTRGRSEWQLSPTPRPLVWQSGPDAAFWGNLAAVIVVGGLTVWAYFGLATSVRAARAEPGA